MLAIGATLQVDNMIKVCNHSNATVYAKFSFENTLGLGAYLTTYADPVNAAFTSHVLTLESAVGKTRTEVETTDETPRGKVIFTPLGKTNTVFEDGKIGTVVISNTNLSD